MELSFDICEVSFVSCLSCFRLNFLLSVRILFEEFQMLPRASTKKLIFKNTFGVTGDSVVVGGHRLEGLGARQIVRTRVPQLAEPETPLRCTSPVRRIISGMHKVLGGRERGHVCL